MTSEAANEDLSRAIGGINVLEPTGADAGMDGAVSHGGADARPLTADEFTAFAAGLLATSGIVLGQLTRNPGFRALAVSDQEQAGFTEAARSVHHLALAYPQYLGWIIQPANKTIQCVVTIGVFGHAKAQVVKAAIAAHRQQPKPAPSPTPAETAARMQ